MDKTQYWKAYKFIWLSEPFKTSLGPWDKKIYELFRDRWEQSHLSKNRDRFTDESGHIYFTADEQKTADFLGISRATVSRAVTKLKELGVLRVFQIQVNGTKKINHYYMYPIFHDLRIAAEACNKKLQVENKASDKSPVKACNKKLPVTNCYMSKNEYISSSNEIVDEPYDNENNQDNLETDLDPWSD